MFKQISCILCIAFLHISTPLFSDQFFETKNHNQVHIAPVKSVQEIDLQAAEDILVRSFMDVYEDVPLIELNPEFKSTGDVRRFYQNFFAEELEHFKNGHLFWVQAFENEKLVGWATFALDPHEDAAVYMNLLIVSPEYQQMGIGKHLSFSILSEELLPNLKAIHLLIRKVNIAGKQFYERIGFVESDYQHDNFIDTSLLTGMSWHRSE